MNHARMHLSLLCCLTNSYRALILSRPRASSLPGAEADGRSSLGRVLSLQTRVNGVCCGNRGRICTPVLPAQDTLPRGTSTTLGSEERGGRRGVGGDSRGRCRIQKPGRLKRPEKLKFGGSGCRRAESWQWQDEQEQDGPDTQRAQGPPGPPPTTLKKPPGAVQESRAWTGLRRLRWETGRRSRGPAPVRLVLESNGTLSSTATH